MAGSNLRRNIMTIRLEDVVMPPAPAALVRRRGIILTQLSIGAASVTLTFAGATFRLATAAFAAYHAESPGQIVIWLTACAMLYVATGFTMCVVFVTLLGRWSGPPRALRDGARIGFCLLWPAASVRLMLTLLSHRTRGVTLADLSPIA
jgi:hypothetical protein